ALSPSFLLVAADMEAQAWLAPRALDQWRRLGGERVVLGTDQPDAQMDGGILRLVERDHLFADWIARHGARAAVVRPDRYVYGTAHNRSALNGLVENLARQIFG